MSVQPHASGVRIYHNPACSKSRQTLELLRSRGLEPEVILYLKTPPAPGELNGLLELLELAPRELMRQKNALYEQLGLDDPHLSRDQLIAALSCHPELLERPIVVTARGARLGRPPEAVLDILPAFNQEPRV
jgi:arsenate reductase